MSWMIKMALREARHSPLRGLVMLFSMVFGLTVLVSFSSIKEGFQENFYEIATVLTGGDLRVEIVGNPTERLQRLLPRLGDTREAYWGQEIEWKSQGGNRQATLWFVDLEAQPLIEVDQWLTAELPDSIPVDVYIPPSEFESLDKTDLPGSLQVGPIASKWNFDWLQGETDDPLPPWMKRIKRDASDRWVAQTSLRDRLTYQNRGGWQQIWVYHVEGEASEERIDRSRYILEYIQEESKGVELLHELPSETGFYSSFALISNTLFLAAFSALLLGTLAYTVTFVDLSRGKSDYVALLRCLGAWKGQAWGIHGVQVLVYVLLSVLLAGGLSVAVQWYLPQWISQWTGVPMEVEIFWRSLLLSLGFGGCFILFPGIIAIMPMVSCEPAEVLRSVKMPTHRREYGWVQSLMAAGTLLLAITFCLQMVDDGWFATIFLISLILVFALLLAGVSALRGGIRALTRMVHHYPVQQAASNLFRPQNHYVFTLGSIAFGLFLITFLSHFF